VLVVAIGGLVLCGWALHLSPLIRLLPSEVAMNPVTAVIFILAGISLWRLGGEPLDATDRRDRLGLVLAGLVVLAGALRLADYLLGLGFEIEHLLFARRVVSLEFYPPNEMAPNTALSFLLCGLALLLFGHEPKREFLPAQLLILPAGLIALLALIGYSYRVLSLYQVGMASPMALSTAVGFALFCAGFLAARPNRGILMVVNSQTVAGTVARHLLPLAILVPWLLGALLLMGEQRGFYDREFALSMFAVLSILIFTSLIWWNATLLYRAEMKRVHTEDQLRQTSANLERSNNDLQQFAYVASRDLFEPLRMVLSYLELLTEHSRDKLDQRAQEFIGFAIEGAQRMKALIDDLMEYSRVESRGRKLEPTDCELVFNAAISNLKVAVQESGTTVAHEPLPKVMGDRVQLTQLFQNLIGNALKFHGPEPPRVEMGAHRRNGEWLLFVRDYGIGIEPKDFDRIFVIFQRLHTRREYPGTGIGLSICKKIVERHGGSIWVESTPGKGATFFFTLRPAPETDPWAWCSRICRCPTAMGWKPSAGCMRKRPGSRSSC
jgi:signal transduction histidine kinase